MACYKHCDAPRPHYLGSSGPNALRYEVFEGTDSQGQIYKHGNYGCRCSHVSLYF